MLVLEFPPRLIAVLGDRGGRRPRAVVVVGPLPALAGLAAAAPAAVDREHQGCPGVQPHHQLAQQAGRRGRRAAVGDLDAQGVAAGLQPAGDVQAGGSLPAAAVARVVAVDVQRERVVGGDQERGLHHAAAGGNLDHLAEVRRAGRLIAGPGTTGPEPRAALKTQQLAKRRGPGILGLRHAVEPDPLGLPIRRLEQSHRPPRRRAPGRLPAVLVPHADFPVAVLGGMQLAARVLHVNRLVGSHLAAVPAVALVGLQRGRRAGYQDPIGRLAQAAKRRVCRRQHPTQTRPGGVDADRVGLVLAPQLVHRQTLRRRSGPARSHQQGNSQRATDTGDQHGAVHCFSPGGSDVVIGHWSLVIGHLSLSVVSGQLQLSVEPAPTGSNQPKRVREVVFGDTFRGWQDGIPKTTPDPSPSRRLYRERF